jgi:hypothetical protein
VVPSRLGLAAGAAGWAAISSGATGGCCGYYREQWEEDMVAALLDGWLTGDLEADEYISKAGRPSWAEVASVAGLAARRYLGGAGAPRRYFA